MKITFYWLVLLWLVVLLRSALTLGGQFLPSRPCIGLALSTGGAGALAFLCSLNAPSAQVQIAYLLGTSIGATVDSRYAAQHFSEAEKGPLLPVFRLLFTKPNAWLTGTACAIFPAPPLRLAL